MDTLSRLDLARDAGFPGVEVNLEPWQEVSLASSDEDLADLRRMVEAHGLCVSTVYSREQWHTPMSSPDPDKRARCRHGGSAGASRDDPRRRIGADHAGRNR